MQCYSGFFGIVNLTGILHPRVFRWNYNPTLQMESSAADLFLYMRNGLYWNMMEAEKQIAEWYKDDEAAEIVHAALDAFMGGLKQNTPLHLFVQNMFDIGIKMTEISMALTIAFKINVFKLSAVNSELKETVMKEFGDLLKDQDDMVEFYRREIHV